MSDQKHPNQNELFEHTGQIDDNANAPLELSKGDLKLRSELLEAESRTEIKESVSGPELWPKTEELKSNPQSKLEEQQLNPKLKKVELRPEVKKAEQSSPPWPEESESRTEIKDPVSGPEMWPKPEELKSNPQPKLEEQQLNPELKKVELRPEVNKTEQNSQPWPEETESRTEIKEPVSGPELWPKPEELKSNPQPKLSNPELKEVEGKEVESRQELKKAEQCSQPGPEESEFRTDMKASASGPELWPESEKLKLNQQPKLEQHQSNSEQNEVELRQEIKEMELRAELTKAEQSSQPGPEETESRTDIKESVSGPELWPKLEELKSNSELKEVELRQELKEVESRAELTIAEQSSQLEPELGPEKQKSIPELGPEQSNLGPEPGTEQSNLGPGTEQPGPDKQEKLQLEPEHPHLGPEKPQPGADKPELGPEQIQSEPKKPQSGPEKPHPDPEKPLPHPEKPQPEPERPQPGSDQANLWPWVAALVLLFAIVVGAFLNPLHGTQNLDSKSATQIFQDKFKSLQNDFPRQSRHLWLRSGKMLTNHLNKSDPGEPATIILTAAQDAKRTLLCLGSGLAESYAIAHNSSWLVIHGPSEAQYDDSTAKLHIDDKLSKAFESTHRAAVLSHLETLPAGALLILYKYCDHENAAYKNVALVFTVLLEDSSLNIDTPLPDLEEKVRDFLWQQFITSDSVRSHQEMDSDKLGGVWSRISHLVLPVLPVESIEFGNCPFDYKGN